ncbi:MAG TPA: hypothetical protein VM487_18400, partial [Phycisphaerae bacterium]|nr:hypothetical protein [Phycisphaerae bacterium]
IDCDLDGRGKRWRLARVQEVASSGEPYFWATFFWATFIDEVLGDEFEEDIAVFRENGSRIVGPFLPTQLLTCIEVAEFVALSDPGFLPQVKPGERPITAGRANGLGSAAAHFMACDPSWKRENFD